MKIEVTSADMHDIYTMLCHAMTTHKVHSCISSASVLAKVQFEIMTWLMEAKDGDVIGQILKNIPIDGINKATIEIKRVADVFHLSVVVA